MKCKRVAKENINGTISYYYTDHLGSTRAVDISGEITHLDYAPFGEDFRPTSKRYKFTGKEDDVLTGLYYYNARYYDPAIGRFITEDPAKDGGNWYVYCGNSPLRYVDPTGKHFAGGLDIDYPEDYSVNSIDDYKQKYFDTYLNYDLDLSVIGRTNKDLLNKHDNFNVETGVFADGFIARSESVTIPTSDNHNFALMELGKYSKNRRQLTSISLIALDYGISPVSNGLQANVTGSLIKVHMESIDRYDKEHYIKTNIDMYLLGEGRSLSLNKVGFTHIVGANVGYQIGKYRK